MRRLAWLALVSCAANHGAATHQRVDAPVPMKRDPHAEFRARFANPGGMWMPMQMALPQHREAFERLGVALDPKVLADPQGAPLGAVVILGGCTASFVSPEGLLLTNHHCAQSALVFNSSGETDLVQNGFTAAARSDEKWAGPAQRALVPQSYQDVTAAMTDGLDAIADPVSRKQELDHRRKARIAACEKDRPWLRCYVSKFFSGGLYQLIEMLEIPDVRLVYVPRRSVGNYGGEQDNWSWPRHTGDFSVFRAYVGKNGRPAAPSPDNVPFKPAQWLQVTTAGVEAGDFVMVIGYPGFTSRTATAAEIHHEAEWHLPYFIDDLQQVYDLAASHTTDRNHETAIKATALKQAVQNLLEKLQSELAVMKASPLLADKDHLDDRVHQWAAQPGREQYRTAIARLEQLLAGKFRTARADFEREETFNGSSLLAAALSLSRWAHERAKPDADRRSGFQDRDMARAVARQKQLAKELDRTLDREGFELQLVRALQLPEAERPWLAALLGVKPGRVLDKSLVEKTLDTWYQETKLGDENVRLGLLASGTASRLAASTDPFITAAQRVLPIVLAQERVGDARAGELSLVEKYYVDAMRQVLGGALAPDANGTLRITYATVKARDPASHDTASQAFTTADQIVAKDTGQPPYAAPAEELTAIRAKRYGSLAAQALGGELPVDFTSDADITGGNSGSPTLNARGELVGLAFDGTKEMAAADVTFNGARGRAIHLDARYMVWIMDAIDGADRVVEELGLRPQL